MDAIITLGHGAGGTQTARLIEELFAAVFENPLLTRDDAAVLRSPAGRMAMTTDGFVVTPAFFAGGDIGKLSVCGTVNDLACMGAKPLYLTCSFIIEEGFAVDDLRKIVVSMARTAAEAGVAIVAGDTKVVPRGQCGGVFIATAGVGQVMQEGIGGARAADGDAVLVTGDVGRHGCAILLARDEYGMQADITSDCAPLWSLTEAMLTASSGELHAVRDATRGGLGTVLNEIARQSGVNIEVEEEALPVQEAVAGLCGLLGLDPLYMACEGRMAVFVPRQKADAVLQALHSLPYGRGAAVIGHVAAVQAGGTPHVTLKTPVGGRRLLSPPGGELLPRIC